MANRNFGLGTVLYTFNPEFSKVLLLRLNDVKSKKFNADWGNVGGKMNVGEPSLDSCIREAGEEIGISFKPEDIKFVYMQEEPNHPVFHIVRFVYATRIREDTRISLGKELAGYSWFEINRLPSRTLDGREDYSRMAEIARSLFKR